ncbi:Na/Pi cotransporter family protein [Paenibacillus antri]|uniref:Na/Pi cotransporter family protein n=1 Tax=Paenibacillus antri TaxID=2582848 RepID=A0A5R9GAC5_9BACL|nr:Na/Pi symporter [Paenibacillus antri]TLS50328.1 Na/Pi cotransporter family protein [Paenibacillus antri]
MWQELAIPFGLGFAVFLFGMKAMEIGLHEWAGPILSGLIRRFTSTPFRGLVAGTLATTVLQSSDAVTVVTIGLVNAGVLTFRQTLGIVLGANVGGSITADMLGLDMSAEALPMLVCAGVSWFACLAVEQFRPSASRFARLTPSLRHLSLTACGFACVLIGMERMNTIVPVLQSRGLFVWFLDMSQQSIAWGLLAGAIVTAVIQSSAATIAVTMGLASVQAVPIELGIAIVLGANIGTCSTALLASLGGSKAGRYVAWSHIALNLGGSLLFFPFIEQLAALSAFWTESPYDQIARAQTIFNVLCSLIALPLCYLGLNKLRPQRIRP